MLRAGGSPLKLAPTGVLRLPAGKHTGILTELQTKVNKKMTQKSVFLATPVNLTSTCKN
jgi:hypothetical protein